MRSKVLMNFFILLILFSGVVLVSADVGDSSTQTFTVGPSKVLCTGTGPQECLVVNGSLFYWPIQGFEHEEGYVYELKINRTQVYDESNPPADAIPFEFSLIEVVSKREALPEDEVSFPERKTTAPKKELLNTVCGDGICEGQEPAINTPNGCPQDCSADLMPEKSSDSTFMTAMVILVVVFLVLYLIKRKK